MVIFPTQSKTKTKNKIRQSWKILQSSFTLLCTIIHSYVTQHSLPHPIGQGLCTQWKEIFCEGSSLHQTLHQIPLPSIHWGKWRFGCFGRFRKFYHCKYQNPSHSPFTLGKLKIRIWCRFLILLIQSWSWLVFSGTEHLQPMFCSKEYQPTSRRFGCFGRLRKILPLQVSEPNAYQTSVWGRGCGLGGNSLIIVHTLANI